MKIAPTSSATTTAPTDERIVGLTLRSRPAHPGLESVGDRGFVLVIAAPAPHQQPEGRPLDPAADEFADDSPLEDDQDPVAEVEDLVEIERDQEHSAPLVPLQDQLLVHELDRADVESPRRLHCQ